MTTIDDVTRALIDFKRRTGKDPGHIYVGEIDLKELHLDVRTWRLFPNPTGDRFLLDGVPLIEVVYPRHLGIGL